MRPIIVAFVAGFLVSCGTIAWRSYTPEMPSECYDKGILRAHEAKDDKPMTLCKPDDQDKGKCNILSRNEFEALVKHDDECTIRLIACEERCPAH